MNYLTSHGVWIPRGGRPSRPPDSHWSRPIVLMTLALIPVVYSIWVSWVVAWMGDIGLNCVIGTVVREQVGDEYAWRPAPPAPAGSPSCPSVGDVVLNIG